MTRTRAKRPPWLLAVASAYSLLPGCGDDGDESIRDASVQLDAGGVIAPHSDGGGRADASVTNPSDAGADGSAQPTFHGSLPAPPPDGGLDAGCDDPYILNGIVVRPADAGCSGPELLPGVIIKAADGEPY